MKQYNEKHINDLSKSELEKLTSQGQLIDVRTQEEYKLGHINGAILHPVDEIESFNKDKNKPIIYTVKVVIEVLKLVNI